jgi:DNA-binding transcriptional LysR family regulator
MHWSDVQLFLALARDGSVRAAARALKVDASTVSRRLAALEQSAGVRLVERTSTGLLLTSAGRVMVESGERVDQELAQLARRIVGRDRRMGGVVRVTCPGSFAMLVHEAVQPFLERHPDIELELLTGDALLEVDGRQADIALRVAAEPPPHLVGRRVASLAGAVYASRAYVDRHGKQLDGPGHAWVEWDRRLASKPAFAWLDRRFAGRRVAVRGLSTLDVLRSIAAGTGVGALPCIVGDAEPGLLRLVDAPRETWSSVWLLTHAELKPAVRVRALLAHLGRVLKSERPRIEGDRMRRRAGATAETPSAIARTSR